MIKWTLVAGGVVAGIAFAAGCYVGWKTTLNVISSVKKEKSHAQRSHQ